MRRGRGLPIVVAIVALGAVVWGISSRPGGSPVPRAAVRPVNRLVGASRSVARFSPANDRGFALRIGSQMGDAHPTGISTVSSTRGRALSVMSPGETVAGVPGSVAVHVIAMHGQFIDDAASPPSGQGAPKGTWLTVSIDASTGEVLDLSLTNQRPALTRLGKVNELSTPN
jgi:hypothetical protein